MRPREPRDTGQQDLLRSRLDQIVNPPLAKLARTIDWGFLKQKLGAAYTDRPGRPANGRSRHPQLHAQFYRKKRCASAG